MLPKISIALLSLVPSMLLLSIVSSLKFATSSVILVNANAAARLAEFWQFDFSTVLLTTHLLAFATVNEDELPRIAESTKPVSFEPTMKKLLAAEITIPLC